MARTNMNIWDDKERLDKLEEQRNRLRESGKRLTFDCFNLYFRDKDRAYCSRGKLLGQSSDGSLSLITVLRGVCSGTCKNCKYFNTEEE